MLSQSYNISASWNETWWEIGPGPAFTAITNVAGGYNLSSSDGTPVAATTAAPPQNSGGPPAFTASASINRFSVQNSAGSIPSGVPYIGSITTSAQANWLFQPTGTLLDVSINGLLSFYLGPPWGTFNITLTDLTDSATLINSGPAGPSYRYALQVDATYAANPGDIYELSISEWSHTWGGAFSSDAVTASIASAPEPGAGLLLALGLAGLLGLRGTHCKQAKLENRKQK